MEISTSTLFRYNHNQMSDVVPELILESVLTCPICGQAKREMMPNNACLVFFECEACKAMLRPKAGDCCIFCSYGSVQCPPMQRHQA
jgi:hypothetical protein